MSSRLTGLRKSSENRLHSCPGCGDRLAKRDKNMMGHVIPGVYDGVLFWSHNPGCGRAWHRWPEGARLHMKAQCHIDAVNEAT